MMQHIITEASSFAAQIDHLIDLIFYIVIPWFLLAQFILFSFIIRYSRKRNPKAGYISGESHAETKWIHRAHNLVILCDIVIVYFAVSAWYHVKQELPQADTTIRIVGQQWAWKFTDPGADNQLDTADDITTTCAPCTFSARWPSYIVAPRFRRRSVMLDNFKSDPETA